MKYRSDELTPDQKLDSINGLRVLHDMGYTGLKRTWRMLKSLVAHPLGGACPGSAEGEGKASSLERAKGNV